MRVFESRSERERKWEAYEKARNPVPGRTATEWKRITRTLEQIAARIAFWLDTTNERPMQWLYFHDTITERDDEMQYDIEADFLADYEIDDIGYMLHFHDSGIKATNTIQCISWYESEASGKRMLISKKIFSPLPCETWGKLPITITQWRKVATVMIDSHCLWKWVHAVREYQSDNTIKLGGVMGWYLQPTQRVRTMDELKNGSGYFIDGRSEEDQQKDKEGWPGVNIYQDIIGAYSQDAKGK